MIEITVAYYLGIDGGGSKTKCVIGDELAILASATAGPSNITRIGEGRARESLHEAIHAACAAAKVSPHEIKSACVGAAGAAREEIASAVRSFVAELISGAVEVVGDMAIALEAAFGAGPGIIVIAGTGSIAYGRDGDGNTARAGGWGFAVSDEGSAHWIGRQAVSEVLRAADERDGCELAANNTDQQAQLMAAPLFRRLEAVWNVSSLEQLARKSNSNPDFAGLFPAVEAAAESGDDLAQLVLNNAAAELARLATIIVRCLFPKDRPSVTVSMAMVGGVFRHSQQIRSKFAERICARDPRIALNREIAEPVYGALQMARRFRS